MTLDAVIKSLPLLSPVVLFAGIITGGVVFKCLDKIHKSLYIYLLLMLIVDLFSRLLYVIQDNNLIVLPIYSLIELLFFMYFFKKHLFKKQYKILTAIGCAGVVFILGEIIYYFILNKISAVDFQPYCKAIDNAVIIVLTLTFLQEKMSAFKDQWENFRLNIAILVFFTLNTLIFLPFNFLVNESSGVKFYFWAGNLIMLLFFYGFLINEIWKNGRIRR